MASVSFLVSILIFAVGFSELIKDYPLITRIIQVVGVAYILYLAYKQWTSSGVTIKTNDATPENAPRWPWRGISQQERGLAV